LTCEQATDEGRFGAHFEALLATRDILREAYAGILDARPEDVALTTSTSEGLVRVLSGLELAPGDEVLTAPDEHPGLLAPLAAARDQRGIVVRTAAFEDLADAVTPASGLALGHALRRIADSQILEALGATTARYWDVVDGKTVSLFEASFALADEAAGGALPDAMRDSVRSYGRLFQYVDDLQDIGGVADALGKPTGLDADNQLHTLPAADLVVSTDAVRERLRELSEPIVRLASGTDWADHFTRMTEHLLRAAARALDHAAV
jgi:hypothetical protein